RVLDELCSNGDCKGITSNPTGELSTIVNRLSKHSLRGTVVNGHGRKLHVSMNDLDMLQITLGGDLNPTLRAELPGSVHSALRGDGTPLLRLAARAEGLNEINGLQAASAGDSDALFAATRCEETLFPWDRSAGPTARAQQAVAASRGLS